MKRLALNFICKNESHIVTRMLESVLPITDLIVAVDTGSSDDTISIINEFGKQHDIPTYVFERPFDNFCNSRNRALDRLREIIHLLEWKCEDTWGFWIDCDEMMQIEPLFDRQVITADMYYVRCISDDNTYSKQLFFTMTKQFYWEGPVHEYIEADDRTFSREVIENIHIVYEKLGASWKGDLVKKFLGYVEVLKAYVNDGHPIFRWMFYIGESYSAAATSCKDEGQRKELFGMARQAYLETQKMDIPKRDDRFRLNCRLADNMLQQGEDWKEIRVAFLKAYSVDKRHVEPFSRIIESYMEAGRWKMAYVFSSFAAAEYHSKKSKDRDISELEDSLYEWKIMYYNYYICMQCGRWREGKSRYQGLTRLLRESPALFKKEDIRSIKRNAPVVLMWHKQIEGVKKRIGVLLRRIPIDNQMIRSKEIIHSELKFHS